jgi:molybdopterin molybdotransferase
LLKPHEALELILARCKPLGGERVPLADALGRTLAEDVKSPDSVPGFDNSAMDGFAVRAVDTRGATRSAPARLAVVAESRAGLPAVKELAEGEAIRISTGAMLPAGADAVVRVEDCAERAEAVEVFAETSEGENVRRTGEDIQAGDRVLAKGVRIGPAELGVLASVGAAEVTCTQRPTLVVLTTGDELVEPGDELGPGQIRNTNAHTVPAQATLSGALVSSVEFVPDDYRRTLEAIERALGADVVVVCGGVSVGQHDHVKPALAELGVEEVFWGVALRPGHPTWFGTRSDTLVFGLPGNPVSAMVTFYLFVRPALAALIGGDVRERRTTAVMDADYSKKPGRAHVVRCRAEAREDGWHVWPTREQGSHILTSMLGADAFALLDAERGDVSAGERVEIELLGPYP